MRPPSTVLLRTQSDERLVALVRAGHDRAFDAIVERYRKPLLRACVRILPEARAEDALQQALVAAWKGLERGDEVQELRPWLYRIARNTALNQLRVAGYDLDELVETLSAADDPEDEVVRRAVVRQTLAAVAALPERQRDALLRTAVEGRGQDEVARDLGLSDTAVRALVHRARVRIRAAATAVVPLPLASWVASVGGADATVTLAKAGTLAVLAGGAVTAGPTLIHDHGGTRPAAVHTRAATTTPSPRRAPRATATPTPTVVVLRQAPARPEAAHHDAPAPHVVVSSHERGDDGKAEPRERSGGEADEPVVHEPSEPDEHVAPDGSDDAEEIAPAPVVTPTDHRGRRGDDAEPSDGHGDDPSPDD